MKLFNRQVIWNIATLVVLILLSGNWMGFLICVKVLFLSQSDVILDVLFFFFFFFIFFKKSTLFFFSGLKMTFHSLLYQKWDQTQVWSFTLTKTWKIHNLNINLDFNTQEYIIREMYTLYITLCNLFLPCHRICYSVLHRHTEQSALWLDKEPTNFINRYRR